MKAARIISLVLVLVLLVGALAGCGGNIVDNATDTNDPGSTTPGGSQPQGGGETTPADTSPIAPPAEDKTDLTEHMTLKINFTTGNKDRVLTYYKESPMTLPDGTVVTAGMLKPVWSVVEDALNIDIQDVTTQDQKASEMIQTSSTDASRSFLYMILPVRLRANEN